MFLKLNKTFVSSNLGTDSFIVGHFGIHKCEYMANLHNSWSMLCKYRPMTVKQDCPDHNVKYCYWFHQTNGIKSLKEDVALLYLIYLFSLSWT